MIRACERAPARVSHSTPRGLSYMLPLAGRFVPRVAIPASKTDPTLVRR